MNYLQIRWIKMKSIQAFFFLITLAASISLTELNAATDNATINITGRVLSSSCTIESSSAVQNITLPDISARDLNGAGKTGGGKMVNIVLKDCGEATRNVIVTATGMVDTENNTAFANVAADGAGGVALYFYQTDGITKFSPDGNNQETSQLNPSENNTLTYKAAYVSTRDKVKAGAFSTVVNIRFDYQ